MKTLRLMMFLTLAMVISSFSSCDKIEFHNLDNSCLFYYDKMVIICKTYHLKSSGTIGFKEKEEWKIIKVNSLRDLKILDKRLSIDPVVFQTKTKPDLIKALRIGEQVIQKSLNLESKYDYKLKAREIYNIK